MSRLLPQCRPQLLVDRQTADELAHVGHALGTAVLLHLTDDPFCRRWVNEALCADLHTTGSREQELDRVVTVLDAAYPTDGNPIFARYT